MEERFDKQTQERAVLVGLNADCFAEEDTATESTLDELEDLLETAGGFCTGKVLQNRHTPDSHSFIGEGKAQEVRMLAEATQATMVIFDNELSPGNIRALEEIIGLPVLDRSALILDIFAQRAKTKEGRLQVELAQYKYLLPRLSGMGTSLSRQGGGIGTRGPGESKLESDRRHIRRRITALQRELKTVQERRERMHLRRQKNRALTVALVGYTNAGKSTLMNALTDAGVLVADQLFATLDPTARRLVLPSGRQVMLVDTVGLVQRLPHELVDAFRSTLAEAAWADVILDVCDASDPACNSQMQVTAQVLDSLSCGGKPLLHVLNKCDRVPEEERFPLLGTSVRISARTGEGLPQLLAEIDRLLPGQWARAALCIPFDRGDLTDRLHREGKVLAEDYTPAGTRLQVLADPALLEELRPYFI